MRSPKRARRLTATVGGLVIGTLAARIARPAVRRLAERSGISANAATMALETTVPVIAFVAARKIASRTITGRPAGRERERGLPRVLSRGRGRGRMWPEAATARSRTRRTASSAGPARAARAARGARAAAAAKAAGAGRITGPTRAARTAGIRRDPRTTHAPRTPVARPGLSTAAQSKSRTTVETSGPATIRTGDTPQEPTGPSIDLH